MKTLLSVLILITNLICIAQTSGVHKLVSYNDADVRNQSFSLGRQYYFSPDKYVQ